MGGSYSYGLNTPQSDIDERFVFIHTDIANIFGLKRHDHQSKQNDEEDSFGWELRHFLNLLKNGNTICLEALYNDSWIEISEEFEYLQSLREKLIDSEKLYRCLKGYSYSERKLVLGERTGLLGSKRKITLDKYGYSYKNLVQYLRLCFAGVIFFHDGYFPVNVRSFQEGILLFDIKSNPQNYNKEKATKLMDEYEKRLDVAFNQTKIVKTYSDEVANQICYDLYMPILNELSEEYHASNKE